MQKRRYGLIALFTAVALLTVVWFTLPTNAAAPDATNHAQLVVAFGNGNTVVRTVAFTETSITGLDALRRAFATTEDEGAVCAIVETGCPSADCFCAYPSNFWQYYQRDGDGWVFSEVGPADSVLTNGSTEAWLWEGALPPATDNLLSAQEALDWMRPQQGEDGGYGSVGATVDVLLAVASANVDPATWETESGNSLTDYVVTEGITYATTASRIGKLAMGVAAANQDPRNFVGADLVLSLTETYSPATGAFGGSNWDQAYAMLGWRASGDAVPVTATNQLRSRVNSDGGWGFSPGDDSDVDSTALMLEALIAVGEPLTSTLLSDALDYVKSTQEADGGFPYVDNSGSNTNSTAFAAQGIIVAGSDPLTAPWTISNTSPISYILGMQTDEGGFAYIDLADGPDLFATVQTIPGLVGKPFPYLSSGVSSRDAKDWTLGELQADGSFSGFNPGGTIDAVLALKAAGVDLSTVESPEGNTPLDYLTTQAITYTANSASAAGKLVVGVLAAGGDPRDISGFDAVAKLTEFYSTTGAFSTGGAFDQGWGILGYVAAGKTVPEAAITFAKEAQSDNGGWGFDPNSEFPDADSTALMLQALAAVEIPRNDASVQAAFAYLQSIQNGDGGFPGYDGATSASTTGIVLQALAAYNEDPDGLDWTTVITDGSASELTLNTPIDRLLTLQTTDGGFAGFSGPNDSYSTYQALIGVLGVAYPVVEPTPAPEPILYMPLIWTAGE